MKSKTKFFLRTPDRMEVYKKSFANVHKAFEQKYKLQDKTGTEWYVVAETPFGESTVYSDDKWKWS